MTRTLTLAALVVATLTAGAALPAAAQEAASPADSSPKREMHMRGPGDHMALRDGRQREGQRMMRDQRRGGGGVVNLVCSPRGADRLEHRLLNLKQRTDPTAEQQALFDDFQAAALIAQTEFADACAASRPDRAAGTDLDMVDRLKTRLAVQQAYLDGMNTVLPAFEAFYDSLSDEQKAGLAPQRREGKRSERRMPRPDARQGG